MKFKLDENLPLQIATSLKALGFDAHSVDQEGLSGHSDQELWEAVQREERFLITQDLDFSDVRRFAPGNHHGILVIRLHSPSRRGLVRRVEGIFKSENVSGWAGCFVVASEYKLRIRSPLGS